MPPHPLFRLAHAAYFHPAFLLSPSLALTTTQAPLCQPRLSYPLSPTLIRPLYLGPPVPPSCMTGVLLLDEVDLILHPLPHSLPPPPRPI